MGHPLGSGSGPSGGYSGEFRVSWRCSRGVPRVFQECFGMFRACSGFFPGIFVFIFKYPFSWCKVMLENKLLFFIGDWVFREFLDFASVSHRAQNPRVHTSHQLAAIWITLPMKIFRSWFLFNRLHFNTRAESFKAGLRLVRQIWIQILELLRFLLKSKFS